ncbi:TIGR02221 family CRISPR-associated protein [Paraferrimonas haliotis]|uniref:TIGR02221 family CRISPR-associated protein n=1 Tax=Paraferrimonas haliotis TaxID=2013866 RepID=UPI0015CBB44B|nr:TIGR02221 family CRISPR-associated protein [Paraferrimonas haliotis]
MAKVLVALLGTGQKADDEKNNNSYSTTDYQIETQLYQGETLLANVLANHINPDKIILIGTQQSMWDNAASVFQVNDDETLEILEKKERGSLIEKDLQPLEKALNTKTNNDGSRCVIVNGGDGNDELWSNFDNIADVLLKQLNNGDTLYLEITHAFRSLSLQTFVVTEFIKNYKNIDLGGVYYGKLSHGKPSNIINISMFFQLLDWAKAISNLKNNGDATLLAGLVRNSNEDPTVKSNMSTLSESLSIANLSAIFKVIGNLKGCIKLFESHKSKMMTMLADDLLEFINQLDANNQTDFQFNLSQWFANNNNYAMAYICLAEAAVGRVCRENQLYNLLDTEKSDRDFAKDNIIFGKEEGFNNRKTATKEQQDFKITFSLVGNIRNNIAHQLSTSDKRKNVTPKDCISNFKKYYKQLRNLPL